MKLTKQEQEKIINLCLTDIDKSCAIVQCFINNLQLLSCAEYSKLKGKSKRTILYKSDSLKGIKINNRKFITLNN